MLALGFQATGKQGSKQAGPDHSAEKKPQGNRISGQAYTSHDIPWAMENLDREAFKNARTETGGLPTTSPTHMQSLALKMHQLFLGTKQRIMEYTIIIACSKTTHYKVY